MDPKTFREELELSPIHLPRAALRFAQAIAYPELDVAHYINRLDELAEAASKLLSPAGSIHAQAQTLADFLFHQVGLQGNAGNYGDPRNSYINEVLDRRLGIPISLSVIYVYVAQRLGLPAAGVGLPGHFIVGVEALEGSMYLDPFHSGRPLTVEDCANLVQLTSGYDQPFQMEWLNASPPKEILTRMLNNLRNAYLRQEDWPRAVAVVEHLRFLQPEAPEYLRDLGVFHHQNGSLRLAVQFYEQYLLRVPQALDADGVRRSLETAVQQLARLN